MNLLDNTKLFIFDFDGTLAKTNLLHYFAFKSTLKSYNIHFSYNSIAGKSTANAISQILYENKIKVSDFELQQLVNSKKKLFKNYIEDKIQLYSGVIQFINWSLPKFNLAIGTSGSKDNVELSLKKLKLTNIFSPIVCSDDVLNSKPFPDIFLKIIDLSKFEVKEAIIFEDSEFGFIAARKAKIKCVDVKNGFFYKSKIILKNTNTNDLTKYQLINELINENLIYE